MPSILQKPIPDLDVGCHLVLIGGNSLLPARDPLPSSVPAFLQRLALGQLNPYTELRTQIEKILKAGIQPTHLDTHKHTHLAPPVLKAVVRLSEEFRIRWVRRPFDYPLSGGDPVPWSKRAVSRGLQVLRKLLSPNSCHAMAAGPLTTLQVFSSRVIFGPMNLSRSLDLYLTAYRIHVPSRLLYR